MFAKISKSSPKTASCPKVAEQLVERANIPTISMIFVFSRILERIVLDQVYEYLKANKFLTMSQSAFHKLCSTIIFLIDSTDYWYENIDHEQINLAIFLDLK